MGLGKIADLPRASSGSMTSLGGEKGGSQFSGSGDTLEKRHGTFQKEHKKQFLARLKVLITR